MLELDTSGTGLILFARVDHVFSYAFMDLVFGHFHFKQSCPLQVSHPLQLQKTAQIARVLMTVSDDFTDEILAHMIRLCGHCVRCSLFYTTVRVRCIDEDDTVRPILTRTINKNEK